MTFHQRNSFPEAEVERGKQKSLSQAERILAHFQAHRHERLTPFDIHRCLFDATTPPTSIRRAMTDLTNEGLLIKHEDDQVQEIYGVSNCRWSLAPAVQSLIEEQFEALLAVAEFCEWKEDGDDWDSDGWHTSCGQIHILNSGTPKDNQHIYCTYCGKKIREIEKGESL